MIITSIASWHKNRYKIYIDGQFAFLLYKGELSRYCLKEGDTISEELREELERKVVSKRAKTRALHLLESMGRTEAELREKLKKGLYPEIAIDAAVSYVKAYGYINDADYARNYIQWRQNSKSKKELYEKLVNKGVPRVVIEQSMEECYQEHVEQEAIRSILKKRHYQPETASFDEKRKLSGYLARKGFRYEDIRHVLQVSEWNA